jgi:hypothetical protein
MSGFADARRDITGNSWLDDVARASLAAAEAKFEGVTAPFLAVDVDADLDALALSTIAKVGAIRCCPRWKPPCEPHG